MNMHFKTPLQHFSKGFMSPVLFPKKYILLLFFLYQVLSVSALNIPQLREPGNNTINLSRVLVLKIKPNTEVNTTYIFQTDINVNFNSASLKSITTSDTAVAVYDCLYNTKYYWRVRAVNDGVQSAWSSIYNFTTVKKLINITSPLSNQQSCNFLFQHTATKLKRRYWLDTSANFTSPLLRDISVDTSLTIQYTESIYFKFLRFNTKYYLKVIAYNDQDTLFTPVSILQFTTKKAPLKAAEAIPFIPNPISYIAITTYFEQFYDSLGDNSIMFISELDTSAQFNSPMLVTHYNNRLMTLNLYYGRKYYLRTKVAHIVDTSEWSPTGSFSTAVKPLITKSSLNNEDPDRITFHVSQMSGLLRGDFTLFEKTKGIDSGYVEKAKDTLSRTSSSGVIMNMDYGKEYLFIYREMSLNDTSEYDSVVFNTQNLRLLTPYNNETNVQGNPVLTMQTSTFATAYEIELDTALSFSSPALQRFVKNDSTQTDFKLADMPYNHKFYWRGRMVRNGALSAWCDTFIFYTGYTEIVFTNPPYNEQIINPKNFVFKWTKDPYAKGYHYEVDTSESFAHPVVSKYITDPNQLSDSVLILTYNQQYYARIRQYNTIDTVDFSVMGWPRDFKTKHEDSIPEKQVLLYPENFDNSNLYSSVLFEWGYNFSRATSFEFQLSKNNLFDTLIAQATIENKPGRTHTVNDLEPHTIYFWRIRGLNDKVGSWSEIFQFTTIPFITAPDGLNPDHYNKVAASNVQLTWNKDPFAATYQYQLTHDTLPYTHVSPVSVTDSFIVIPQLFYGRKYKWRVRSYIISDLTEWSEDAFFTVGLTGLSSIDKKDDFMVSPNPVNDYVKIKGGNLKGKTATIYDSNGILKLVSLLEDDHATIDLSRLQKGLYFIELDGSHQKIVKE